MKIASRRPRSGRAEQMAAESAEWVPTGTREDDLVSAVADSPLFAGMPQAEVARAVREFDEARYPSDRRIVLEGQRGCDFFVIVVGTAAVLVDGWRVATLGPGDFFGEMAVLGDGQRMASVRAESPMHCLVLPNDKLPDLVLAHPRLGVNLMHSVVRRFTDLNRRRPPPVAEAAGA